MALSARTVRVRAEPASVADLLSATSRLVPGLGWAAREAALPADDGTWPIAAGCVLDLFTTRVWLATAFELHPPEEEAK